MMKRFCSLALAILFLSCLFFGCSGEPPKYQTKLIMEYQRADGSQQDIIVEKHFTVSEEMEQLTFNAFADITGSAVLQVLSNEDNCILFERYLETKKSKSSGRFTISLKDLSPGTYRFRLLADYTEKIRLVLSSPQKVTEVTETES